MSGLVLRIEMWGLRMRETGIKWKKPKLNEALKKTMLRRCRKMSTIVFLLYILLMYFILAFLLWYVHLLKILLFGAVVRCIYDVFLASTWLVLSVRYTELYFVFLSISFVSSLITVSGTDLAVDGGYGAMGPEGLGESSKFAGTWE